MVSTLSLRGGVSAADIGPWSLIDAIGRSDFYGDLLRVLERVCGSDLCAVYRLEPNAMHELGSADAADGRLARDRASWFAGRGYWRRDPEIREVHTGGGPSPHAVVRADLPRMPGDLRSLFYADIAERVGIYGRRGKTTYWLSVLRSARRGGFDPTAVSGLSGLAESLISAVAKHEEILRHRPEHALASIEHTEVAILATGRLSQREAEVCARLLHGVPFGTIARDLGVGEETVKTYRNRAYHRLDIAQPRELLTWYLSIWTPDAAIGGTHSAGRDRGAFAARAPSRPRRP